MATSKIEQLIEEIYEFVESCKLQAFSTAKVIVPKDELYDLLDELKLRTPDEIKRYQKIISNRDAIIQDAEEKAVTILAEAKEKTSALVDEHEIMQQAYHQANEMVTRASEEAREMLESAERDSNEIRTGALAYSESMLTEIENVLDHAYSSVKSKYDGLIDSLKGNLDIVRNNRSELTESLSGAATATNDYSDISQYDDEEFEFEENEYNEED